MRRSRSRIGESCRMKIVPTVSRVGGGALPEYGLDSWAVELHPLRESVAAVERGFRTLPVPVVGRIEHDRLLIDFRTVQDDEVAELSTMLIDYFNRSR